MDEGSRRTRISLGPLSLLEKDSIASVPRKRAVSIAGTRVVSPRSVARRSLVSSVLLGGEISRLN